MYKQLNGSKGPVTRTNSICPTPEEILLKAVLKNDRREINQIVETRPDLLSHLYNTEAHRPILLIACYKENVEADTVRTLIDLGADLYYSSSSDHERQALHVAALTTKSETLKAVVEKLKNPGDINSLAEGSNALHILIRYGKNEPNEEFVECAKILIQEGIDVNQGDTKNISPILWAAKKGYKEIVKVILECSDIPVDIDSHQVKRKANEKEMTAREIISEEKLYDGILPEKLEYNNENDTNTLFKHLQSRNEDAFINYKNGDIFDLVNSENSSSTLLQMSCEKCLKRATEHLINKGANVNSTGSKNKKRPIEITAENGSYEIFQLLLKSNQEMPIPTTVLVTLLKKVDNVQNPSIGHEKCYEILLKKIQANRDIIDVNERDDCTTNSPLHYAVRYCERDKIEQLLELGASLGSKNRFDVIPVQDIEPEVLERHLDNCIEFDLKTKKFEKEDFEVTFNYRTLIPPSRKIEYNVAYENSDPETNLKHTNSRELVVETEVIAYMSKAPEFKHLLTHPVIVSFLFMKWYRIQWLFYINLAFYIAFFLSLVVYIFVWYANFSSDDKSSVETFLGNASFGILLITYIILVFRELFQITASSNKYFKNFENFVEIILICFTGSILFISNPEDDTKKILSSVSILLAAFELVLMVGQHPNFSTNVVMLKTVSLNFFKFFAWYSLLIVAFALSFYILFCDTENKPKDTTSDGEEEDFFTDIGKSLFKTIVMLTGEFDAGSLNFQHFPVTSKVMFALFIFMIAIILLNLLNGLAVSDTQQIKNNAELVGHIARAQHIQYVESMILGNILPRNICKKINDFCCCLTDPASCNYTIFKPLAKKSCFPHYLDYKLTVSLNNHGRIYLENEKSLSGKNCVGSCAHVYLDKETIRRTNRIIQGKRESLKTKLHNIEDIKKDISEIHKTLDDIRRYLYIENNQ